MRRKAIFLLYRALLTLASPLVAGYLVWRIIRNRQYARTVPERLGSLSALWQKIGGGSERPEYFLPTSDAIWIHAVSVGEVQAAAPLIEQIKLRSPRTPVFVSVSTLGGREAAEKRLNGLATGVFFAPLDYAWIVRRVLRKLRPAAVVVLETEIWPNLFREARRAGCGLAIVNGRISDSAISRYRGLTWFFREVFPMCDRIYAQSDEMRGRFLEAGAPEGIVATAGNLKYDFRASSLPPDSPIRAFVSSDRKPVWIAASTSTDGQTAEEDDVLAAQHALSGWRLILAPRKPHRFDEVARKVAESGLRWTKRSALTDPVADVLLLDSIGELAGCFELADAVFMGGTLADMGGHNILEPAVAGKPIVAGPHLENFRDIERLFERRRAIHRIASGVQLASAIHEVQKDVELGARAREAAAAETGASARAADLVMELYGSRYCKPVPTLARRAFLGPMATIWRVASARDRRLKTKRSSTLPAPVISIGNITAGGTGKTPVVIELVRELTEFRPAVLTRGYGRSARDQEIAITGSSGAKPAIERTGDEAQLIIASTGVPMGIGADRFRTGTELFAKIHPGIFVLDDGFQHLQIERDFDLVLIDALSPFGGGELIPLGRLREPIDGLSRADAFVITRSDAVANVGAIEHTIRMYNQRAPIYRARIEHRCWTDRSGTRKDPGEFAGTNAIAFCGLGNPRSFWRSLTELGVRPMEEHSFGDHHRYAPNEFRRLTRHAREIGAEVLLTTAKDAVNLCAEFESIASPLPVWWLEIGIAIENRNDLMGRICAAIAG